MSLSGGDRLARGAKSAAFSTQAGISDFENDLIFRPEIVAVKYGLTETQISEYQQKRDVGEKMPDLPSVLLEVEPPAEAFGFSVKDNRPSYMDTRLQEAEVVAPALKYPEREYTPFRPILDRILVMRVSIDKNMEILSDGSLRDKRTGFVIPAKYRQHQNVGIVLAAGDFVVMGGAKISMEEVIRPGDRVMYGEYNAEAFQMPKEQATAMCDRIGVNYEGSDEETFWIVRCADVRGVEAPINEVQSE